MFVDAQPVEVTLDGVDKIWVKPRMDFGTHQRVHGSAYKQNGTPDVGEYTIALLIHNVVRWEGPSFAGRPCTPENIERLDPDEPLVDLVMQTIREGNRPRPKG